MKQYFDRNNTRLMLGDPVKFYDKYTQRIKIGKILDFRNGGKSFDDSAYVGSLKNYEFGIYKPTKTLTKISDEEMMLIILEN
jgi:hypothetical protein